MEQEFPELSQEESLKAENEFLKMKMMLENGAQFQSLSEEISPELENFFLNQVMEFENQSLHASFIKIYDKIERPSHFKPVALLADEEVQEKLDELLDYLEKYGINLDVYSPNIPAREIYRFITEELFNEDIQDLAIEGIMSCFVYDEYHPDPVYENTRIAVENGMKAILSSKLMTDLLWFRANDLQLNDHYNLTPESFREKINLFKLCYDTIDEPLFNAVQCHAEGSLAFVKGNYTVRMEAAKQNSVLSGKWLINLEKDEFYSWTIHSVQIEGISF